MVQDSKGLYDLCVSRSPDLLSNVNKRDERRTTFSINLQKNYL
jgi:hypothetical protein